MSENKREMFRKTVKQLPWNQLRSMQKKNVLLHKENAELKKILEDATVISWNPSNKADLATSAQENKSESQYYPIDKLGMQLARGAWGYNLCGHLAVSIPFETVNNLMYTLEDIWKANGSSKYPMSAYELWPAVKNVFSKQQPWKMRTFSWSTIGELSVDGEEYEDVGHYWWLDDSGNNRVLSILKEGLQHGRYPVPLVEINSNGALETDGDIDHWVVVTGISSDDKWVRINNPFQNREEIYTWEYFQQAMEIDGSRYTHFEIWQQEEE
jgi:hypothetical protein